MTHFRLGQGQETDNSHTAGERVRDTRQGHQIRRPGEQKPPRPWVSVYRGLERQEESRRTLNLVDHRPIKIPHEAYGVGRGSIQDGSVVECDEWKAVGRDLPRQRGFSRLPRAAKQHDPGVLQRLAETVFDKARIHNNSGIIDQLKDKLRPIESQCATN